MEYLDLINQYEGHSGKLRALLYGGPGSGKTTLAASFPNIFFIDTDRGLSSLRGVTFPYIQLTNVRGNYFDTVLSILTDAKAKSGPFAAGGKCASVETIVIDSFTSLADDYLLPECMKEGGRNITRDKAIYDDYGKLKQRLGTLSNVLKDLSEKYNIVVTALVDEEKNELTGELRGKPLMTGKYRDKIGADYDEEYYLESTTNREGSSVYTLYASPFRWFEGKTRNLATKKIVNPTYTEIVKNFK